MQRLNLWAAVTMFLATVSLSFWFITEEPVKEPIILEAGMILDIPFYKDIYEVLSIERHNDQELVCVKSTKGTMFITNNGGTTAVQESYTSCSNKDMFVSILDAKGFKLINK